MKRIVLALVVLFVPVVARADAPKPANALKAYITDTQGKLFYGVYAGKNKVGWSVSDTHLGMLDDKEVAVSVEQVHIELNRAGDKGTIQISSSTRFSLEGDGELLLHEEEQKENGRSTKRKAVRKGDKLVISTDANGRKDERTVPAPKRNLAASVKLSEWLKGTPKKGDTFELWTVELEENDVNKKDLYTFNAKKKLPLGGVPTDVYQVTILSKGSRQDADLRYDGSPLRLRLGALIEMKVEPEEVAKKLDAGGDFDFMALSSIVVDKDLGFANSVEKLTLEVRDLDDYKFPESHRQKVMDKGKGVFHLELRRDFRTEKEEPLSKEQKAAHLEATPTIQCEDAKIKERVKKIVGDEKDPEKAARLIQRWVFRNMKQTLAANATTALDVLEQMKGDCTEHSILFVALARAAGIPAREVSGVGFTSGDKPSFGWHAWAEVHDGKQWITVDPTWNQFKVDATHVKFADGTDEAWLNVLGKVKFKVVDFETK